MPTREPFLRLLTTTHPLKPVSRAEVEVYLEKFGKVADPLTKEGEVDKMNWQAWRDLRAPDYFIQWNINQCCFRISLDEYIERWKWTIRQGRGWERLDAKIHIIDTGFIVEALLRSTHTDAKGEHIVFALCETYHIQNGKAVFSNEYIDPTDIRLTDGTIPGGW